MLSDKIEPKERDFPEPEVEDSMGEDNDDAKNFTNMR
jgi:hypothetical protein